MLIMMHVQGSVKQLSHSSLSIHSVFFISVITYTSTLHDNKYFYTKHISHTFSMCIINYFLTVFMSFNIHLDKCNLYQVR